MKDIKRKEIEIKLINFGIASRQGDTVYINRKLIEYPYLYQKIVEHELEHTSGFKLKDVVIDLRNNHLRGLKKEYYKFILKNPKSWIEFLPIWIYEKKIAINPMVLFIWGILLILFGQIWGYLG